MAGQKTRRKESMSRNKTLRPDRGQGKAGFRPGLPRATTGGDGVIGLACGGAQRGVLSASIGRDGRQQKGEGRRSTADPQQRKLKIRNGILKGQRMLVLRRRTAVLDICGDSVGDADVASLQKALPDCEI